MTKRAFFLGLIAAVTLVIAGNFGSHIGTAPLTRGHLPIGVFGLLIFGILVINPLLFKMRRGLRFRSGELAVILAMVLAACTIPSAGLMRHFSAILNMPIQFNKSDAGWKDTKVLSYTPPSMLANNGQYEEKSMTGYMSGMGKGAGKNSPYASIDQVPWDQWRGPLATWLPLIILMFLAVICLAMVVHPQWAHRERLKYPIADFATSLLQQDDRALGPIFRNKGFWLACGIILAVHGLNGWNAWAPLHTIKVQTQFDFTTQFTNKFPNFMAVPRANVLTNLILYPAVVGFSYFLASDISFSLGIAHFLTIVIMYFLLRAGVDIAGSDMEGGIVGWTNFGSFLGLAVLLGYIGRRYYWRVLRGCIPGLGGRETEHYAIWACRLFLLFSAATVYGLCRLGLDWPLAILAVGVLMLMFLVMARINAESGLFFYKPPWMMPAILAGLFGAESLGPTMLIILGFFAIVIAADPFECLIPYVTNGLRIADGVGVRVGRVGVSTSVAVVVALLLAVPVVLWADYNYGMGGQKWVAFGAKNTYNAATKAIKTLDSKGMLAAVDGKVANQQITKDGIVVRQREGGYTAIQRLTHMQPNSNFFWSVGIGFVLVLVGGWLRLRLPWWPLHPVIFLCFGAWLMGKFGFSFMLGWFLKTVITRLGGQQKYRQVKPFMVGLIAGDVLGGTLFIAINWVYYAVTGLKGTVYDLW